MPVLYRFITLFLLSSAAAGQVSGIDILVPSPLCTGAPNSFTAAGDPSLAAGSYTWSVSPVVAVDSGSGQIITSTFSNPGTYLISVTNTPVSGGTALSASKKVIVTRSAQALFNASLSTTGYPAELILTNYATGSVGSYWVFSDGIEPDTSVHTSRFYPRSGSYTVTLHALGRNGCDDAASYSFNIPDSSGITMPNIFSPNGDDVNDIYRPLARGVHTLKASIFNRDGVRLAEWDRVNGFWDGRSTSGEPCDEGVYFIILEAVGFDGKVYREKGTITLVR